MYYGFYVLLINKKNDQIVHETTVVAKNRKIAESTAYLWYIQAVGKFVVPPEDLHITTIQFHPGYRK